MFGISNNKKARISFFSQRVQVKRKKTRRAIYI